MCVASTIAARMQRTKIGVAVQVLPLRIAEEAATVDQVSRGRLIFGVGRSGVAKTYEAYGVPYVESRARFAETLEIIEKARTEPVVSYQGRFHSFHDVAVTPQPFQKRLPRSGWRRPARIRSRRPGGRGCRSSWR
jgi:alkanesulfonate monooxygenase SsuD/methylene tetrahydromethanopterin reductase-like flavin-dependent oxidoreductase (luciferase family)